MTNEHSAVSAKITVVVLTHNRCEEVCRTLMHLQALPEDPPIIVVDNGSTDHTAQQIKARFPQATLVQAAQNLGAAGRNLGVKLVKTPYVAFCDDDTWWASGALSTAASLLDTHPDVSVLNARIVVGPRQELDSTCMAMQNSPLESVLGVGPMLIGFMAGANVMRTRAYKEAGGYWKAFFIGGEETLLAMDIIEAGGRIAYAPALVLHHWPSQVRNNDLRQRLIVRNAIWTFWLRLPWGLAWQQSELLLKQIPDRNLRRHVRNEALLGAAKILSKRRVLSDDTCKLFKQVWQQQHH